MDFEIAPADLAFPPAPAPLDLDPTTALSYDDTVPYEEQLPTEAEIAATNASSFASRISISKVYLLSESSVGPAKRKRGQSQDADDGVINGREREQEEDEEDEEMQDPIYRTNAILLNGIPISHLTTARIFAYAKHFDTDPLGLEWIDDNTCVLIFPSRRKAKDAYLRLQKAVPTTTITTVTDAPISIEDAAINVELDLEECIPARSFPVALWPPEERINSTLGAALGVNAKDSSHNSYSEPQHQGLKAPLRIRWAKHTDVKQKGAVHQSQFYKKHGATAGKELFDGRELPPAQAKGREWMDRERRIRTGGRGGADEDDNWKRAQLDNELEDFLREESEDERTGENEGGRRKRRRGDDDVRSDEEFDAGSPPSKMRSDYIASDGRTTIDRGRNGLGKRSKLNLASRLTAPLPRRRTRQGNLDISAPDVDIGLNIRALSDRLEAPSNEKLEWGRVDRGDLGLRIHGASGDDDGRERRGSKRPRNKREREPERERRSGGGRTFERPKKTQQELDDELDAFLRGS